MNRLLRYWRFNLVGAMGMAVQLGALAVLNRMLRGHYLLAVGIAVELAVVHNFLWHVRYTWGDRKADTGGVTTSFVRFQVGNGLVSLVGNVVLMRLLVQGAGLPVLIANLVAIGCCSVANFWVGEVWAFAVPKGNGSPQSARLRRVLLLLPLLLLFYGPGLAQTASAVNLPREGGLGTDCAYANWFVGPASATGGKLSLNTFTGELRLGNTSREASGVASRPLRSSSWEWSGSSRMEPRWMDLGV